MPGGRPPGSKNKPKNIPEEMLDTAEDTLEDIPAEPKKPRAKQPGPAKVIDETGKAIANDVAKTLVKATSKNGKGLLYEEAQSITTPAARIIARRLPKFLQDWGKKFAPKVKVDPRDFADLQEIAVTLVKVGLRLLALSLQEAVTKKEAGTQASQQKLVVNNAPPAAPVPQNSIIATVPLDDLSNDEGQLRVGVSSNGHNPMFSALGYDRGMAGE